MMLRAVFFLSVIAALPGCGSVAPSRPVVQSETSSPQLWSQNKAPEVVMYAMGLLETGYQYGGKNPAAGLDCSGMVSYVFRSAAGILLEGSAAAQARQGRPVSKSQLRPGDLVFFNTRHRAFSHVGIYVGDGKFIHSLNGHSGVRMDLLSNRYYATHYEAARSLFD